MYLMVDVVVNHMALIPNQPGGEIQSNADFNYSSLTFPNAEDYHPFCWVEDYNNQTQVEQCTLGDSSVALVDIDTENSSIVEQLNDWIHGLVGDYAIDGIRIDTVKHVRKDFWPDFVKAAGVFSIGEILIGDVDYLSPYTQVIDSVLDYPGYFALVSAFSKPGGNLAGLIDIATQTQNKYKQGAFMTGSFLENHDNPRFQSMTNDLANAMAYSFVTDGIPILYYGQEQGYRGGNDPNNREAMWLSGFQTSGMPLVAHVQGLNKARKLAMSVNMDFLTTPMKFLPQADPMALAISKPPMLALLTNAGQDANADGEHSWNISGVFSANEEVEDVLTCTSLRMDGDGNLVVFSDGGMPRVLLPASSGSCRPAVSQARGSCRPAVSQASDGAEKMGSWDVPRIETIGLLAAAILANFWDL
uniref:alpha-amylase n=1 Tax=Flammulina velutipes TaxID=38945 RepID=A0A1B2U6U8_FLAVE|nr:alpha-amylase [Flammulina velutipes]